MRIYNKIINGVRTEIYKTRKQFGVGENSSEELCNQRGYFLVIDNGIPSYNQDTHKLVERKFNFDGQNDIVEYIIDEKTPNEIEISRKALVPKTITPLQAKLQLLDMELLDEVEAIVATDRRVALYWNEALEIRRDHPTLVQMATALGLTDTQLDGMFIEASKLL